MPVSLSGALLSFLFPFWRLTRAAKLHRACQLVPAPRNHTVCLSRPTTDDNKMKGTPDALPILFSLFAPHRVCGFSLWTCANLSPLPCVLVDHTITLTASCILPLLLFILTVPYVVLSAQLHVCEHAGASSPLSLPPARDQPISALPRTPRHFCKLCSACCLGPPASSLLASPISLIASLSGAWRTLFDHRCRIPYCYVLDLATCGLTASTRYAR